MEGENGSERENKCKLTPRYEKTPGSRVPREEKPGIAYKLLLLPLSTPATPTRAMACSQGWFTTEEGLTPDGESDISDEDVSQA